MAHKSCCSDKVPSQAVPWDFYLKKSRPAAARRFEFLDGGSTHCPSSMEDYGVVAHSTLGAAAGVAPVAIAPVATVASSMSLHPAMASAAAATSGAGSPHRTSTLCWHYAGKPQAQQLALSAMVSPSQFSQ